MWLLQRCRRRFERRGTAPPASLSERWWLRNASCAMRQLLPQLLHLQAKDRFEFLLQRNSRLKPLTPNGGNWVQEPVQASRKRHRLLVFGKQLCFLQRPPCSRLQRKQKLLQLPLCSRPFPCSSLQQRNHLSLSVLLRRP